MHAELLIDTRPANLGALIETALIEGMPAGLKAAIDEALAAGAPPRSILIVIKRWTGGPLSPRGGLTHCAVESYLRRVGGGDSR